MKREQISTFLFLLLAFFSACNKNDGSQPGTSLTVSNEKISLNPTGYSPLTATISFETSLPSKISIKVVGKNGAESDVVKDFDAVSTKHTIPILGLYVSYNNTVELTFKDASGNELKRSSYKIQTGALPADVYPAITIDAKKSGQITEGMTLVSYFGYQGNLTPQSPFIFDAFGDIRWVLDFHQSSILNKLFYDDGMELLQNGNLYFGDTQSGSIYEIDFFGTIVNTWPHPGYTFHHNVLEKPNGNFLVTVSKDGISTSEDHIIEIDRNSKQIINTWDLRQSLQYGRQALTTDLVDWIHVNAIIYDATDNTIIISGRTQGVVKLDNNNKVVWILGCHKGWSVAGDGTDLKNYLLQPLDVNNSPITDQNVLDGNTNHADFEWNWYQHAPLLMPNGNLMLFDNGTTRNFGGAGQYSRAVEYEINAVQKTVKQVWQYGKERGASTFAPIVSDVDFISSNNHVIFSPGSVNSGFVYGKAIELDYATKEILFEATIAPKLTLANITFHRTERIKLYP